MKNKIWIQLLLLGVMFFSVGCEKVDESTVKIRIGHFPNVTHAQALVARHNDAYQKSFGSNYEVSFHTFNAGPSEIEAFFAGELDLGYIGPVPAINANIKSNGDIVIIAGCANAGAILVVPKDSEIYEIADLSGKKIAIPQFGNTQHLSLLNILSTNGLSDTTKGGTVEVIPAINPDIKTLLINKDIDAAYVPEPWGSRLIIEEGARVLLDFDEVFRGGQYSTAVVIAHKSFIDNHPEAVEQFLKTHYETTKYITNNLSDAKNIINSEILELTGQSLSTEVIDSVFERIVISNDPMTDATLEFMDISYQEGFIDKVTKKENLFRLEFINKILTDNGEDALHD